MKTVRLWIGTVVLYEGTQQVVLWLCFMHVCVCVYVSIRLSVDAYQQ